MNGTKSTRSCGPKLKFNPGDVVWRTTELGDIIGEKIQKIVVGTNCGKFPKFYVFDNYVIRDERKLYRTFNECFHSVRCANG